MKKKRLFSLCNVFLCLLRCQNRFVRLFVHKAYLPNIPKECLPFFQMPALEHQSLGRCLHQNRLDRTGLFGQYNGCCFLKRSWQYQSDNRFLRHIHSQSNSLLYHCKGNLSGINGVLRPGIVHRIDMDTTGAIIACKNDIAHQSLAKQLQVHSITRKYEAIVYHNLQEETGTIDKPIGRHPVHRKKMAVVQPEKGKRAVTHYRVLSHLNHKFNYIECQLETGRTHQIRAQFSHIGNPLYGDTKYGSRHSGGMKLASYKLVFDFKTDAGILNYLNHKEFQISVDFAKTFAQQKL